MASAVGGCVGDIGSDAAAGSPRAGSPSGAGERQAGGSPGGASGASGGGVTGVAGDAERLGAPPPRWGRLTNEQVRNTIADLFGSDVVAGQLDPDLRVEHFSSIGGGAVATSEQGVERYTNLAFDVAAQVMKSGARRARWVKCTPTAATLRACAEESLRRLGRALFRRPLEAETLGALVTLAQNVASDTGDPWTGFEHALAALLQSPRFLYALDQPSERLVAGRLTRLDGHSIATRLALFLTNAAPDEELLDAAAANQLATADGLRRQLDRLAKTPRFRAAVRTFFSSMWDIEKVATRGFDQSVLPKATATLGGSMLEEVMRFLEHHLLDQASAYQAMLLGNVTFINREIAAVYGVEAPAGTGFVQTVLPPASRRFGLLTLGGMLAATSSPRESSPMLRGRMIRQELLCRPIPDPPPDIMAMLPEAPKDRPMTKRERLAKHRENAVCAACHDAMDPPGLALENYDAIGAYRTKEGTLTIDASGDLDGVAFSDARGFVEAVARNPAVSECLVRKLYRAGTGRAGDPNEDGWVKRLAAELERGGRRFLPLLAALVASEAFTHVTLPPS